MRKDDVTGRASNFIVKQLFEEISKSNCDEAMKFFLQGCQCVWLKMKILELKLENYDKQLIPRQNITLLDKSLKLNKIVRDSKDIVVVWLGWFMLSTNVVHVVYKCFSRCL